MEQERKFQGIWIPAEIWLDKRLTAIDKMVLMEIISLDNENGCIASNKYLSEFCQTTERTITSSISKLKKLGYIEITKFDGRIRTIKSAKSKEQAKIKKIKNTCQNTIRNYEEREYTKEQLLSVIVDINDLSEDDL